MSAQVAADDPWYTEPANAWVPAAQGSERPHRYGDLFLAPAEDAFGRLLETSGKSARRDAGTGDLPAPWHAVLVLSPSCDLVSKADDTSVVEVARVKDLSHRSGPQQAAVAAGWRPTETGPRVAYASFVYLAAVPGSPTHAKHMYGDFRETAWLRFGDLVAAGRIAAADHDARVALIRRELHYKYRWLVSMDSVRAAEAARISGDPAFQGPKPSWAER